MFTLKKLCLTLAIVLAVWFIALIPAQVGAEAADGSQALGDFDNICGTWDLFFGSGFSGCFLYMVATVVNIIFKGASWLLYAVGKIFNIVIFINNTSFYNQAIVNIGWKIVRDVVNIFYIFILLIISIATILRIGGYGMKETLWMLVVSALLVNFSLPLTGLVIDASNVLGTQFYMSLADAEDEAMKEVPSDKDGLKKYDISSALIQGFEPENIFKNADKISAPQGDKDDPKGVLLNLIIAYAAGVVLVFVAIFTLVAGAVLLVIRIITLWFVMILSPIAFAAWILPGTRAHANKWWNTLLSQSFFYPAYMFMLYLSIKTINSGVLSTLVGGNRAQLQDMFTGGSGYGGFEATAASLLTQKVQLILSFFMMGAFMIGGLIVAKQMGAHGADAAQKAARGTMKAMGAAGGAIPASVEPENFKFKKCTAEYILVVEKYAVWNLLNQQRYWEKNNCILMTGKGQPARAERRLLARFERELKIPIYIFADLDVYGYYIYSVYKQGSINLAFFSEKAAAPSAKYLGFMVDDYAKFKLPKTALIKMNEDDLKRIKEVKAYDWFKSKEWQEELAKLEKFGYTVESDALVAKSVKFTADTYLPTKIKNKDWLD